ncbi:MAG: aspartyl-tRNA(Asn)/glutamyl-tRNA(Gln) amidotransferase subunit [Betaproteobacteria bacterium]
MSADVHYLSAVEQARLIETRELSPVDLVRASLERIARYDAKLRAYITVCAEQALAEAKQAETDIAAGRYRGALHGLPFGVKDQLCTKDIRTTLGSRIHADYVPDHDATVIARLKAAGAILIGKENLHEFGKGGTHVFPFGQPRNPWNPAHNPAGSSSGSGIAPAAGLCSGSLGEDTGGSVRSPAAANGIVGLRPTFGRVSRYGGVMYGWTADTIGPLTRTVEDNALFLHAIAGHDERDALTSTRAVADYRAQLKGDLKGLRLGVVREMTWPDGIHSEVRAALITAIDVLKSLGARIEDVSLARARYAVPLQMLTSDSDIASMMLTKYMRTHYADLDVGTRTRLAAGALIPSAVYHRAMRARALVRREVLDLMRDYDALISPTNLNPPGRIEATIEKVENAEDMARKVLLRRISTYPFSMANTPALSVPCGYTQDGLPMAMQIAAKPFDESMVFRVGHAYERATDWHRRHPDLDTTLGSAS